MIDILTQIARARADMMARGHARLRLDIGPNTLHTLADRWGGAFDTDEHGHAVLLTMRIRTVDRMEGWAVVPA
jgi:hypothetical protein